MLPPVSGEFGIFFGNFAAKYGKSLTIGKEAQLVASGTELLE
jgi:hypothetical protein